MLGAYLKWLESGSGVTRLFFVDVILNILSLILTYDYTTSGQTLWSVCASILFITILIETISLVISIVSSTEEYAHTMNLNRKVQLLKIITKTLILDGTLALLFLVISVLNNHYELFFVIFYLIYIWFTFESAYFVYHSTITRRGKANNEEGSIGSQHDTSDGSESSTESENDHSEFTLQTA